LPSLKFSGPMDFDLAKCRYNFDFDTIALFNGGVNVTHNLAQAAAWVPSLVGIGKQRQECRKRQTNLLPGSRCERLRQLGERAKLALWKRVVQE
jgi:hypothetical protein